MQALITTNFIKTLQPKTDSRYDVWDTDFSGLHLRVFPSGKMSYRFLYARGKDYTIGSTKAFTVTQARERAKIIMGQRASGQDPLEDRKKAKEGRMTLKGFLEKHYTPWAVTHLGEGGEAIKRLTTCFAQEFGEKSLSEIQPFKIEQWRTRRLNESIKASTVNRNVELLRGVLSKAVEWGMLERHPLKNLKKLRVDSVAKVRYLSKEEEKALRETLEMREKELKAARKRGNDWRQERGYALFPDLSKSRTVDYLKPMVLLSLNTGMRRGELFDLQWENVNFKQSHITVTGETAKSGKTRHIPLNSEALSILKSWYMQQEKKTGLVFSNKDGTRFNNVKKIWGTLLEKANIKKFRWHDMRHHFASRLVMLGVDLNTVRELLGHSDIKMTLRYAHLAPEHKAKAVAKLV